MSERWSRRSLWFSLLLFLPVPSWAFGIQWSPVAFQAELAAPVLWVFAQDGGLVATTLGAALSLQTILWAAVLFFASGRIVHALPQGRRALAAGGIGLTLLALGLALPIYQTAFVYDGRPVNLVGLFQ